jgi:hypothetical protein
MERGARADHGSIFERGAHIDDVSIGLCGALYQFVSLTLIGALAKGGLDHVRWCSRPMGLVRPFRCSHPRWTRALFVALSRRRSRSPAMALSELSGLASLGGCSPGVWLVRLVWCAHACDDSLLHIGTLLDL